MSGQIDVQCTRCNHSCRLLFRYPIQSAASHGRMFNGKASSYNLGCCRSWLAWTEDRTASVHVAGGEHGERWAVSHQGQIGSQLRLHVRQITQYGLDPGKDYLLQWTPCLLLGRRSLNFPWPFYRAVQETMMQHLPSSRLLPTTALVASSGAANRAAAVDFSREAGCWVCFRTSWLGSTNNSLRSYFCIVSRSSDPSRHMAANLRSAYFALLIILTLYSILPSTSKSLSRPSLAHHASLLLMIVLTPLSSDA